jgi:hypothetical protein
MVAIRIIHRHARCKAVKFAIVSGEPHFRPGAIRSSKNWTSKKDDLASDRSWL